MAEYSDVMRAYKHMCKTLDCDKCPLSRNNNGYDKSCIETQKELPLEAEKIIMKWDKENPSITNKDKLADIMLNVFGIDDILDVSGCDCIQCIHTSCDTCKYNNFWEQEYIEPKGEN